MDKSIPRWLSFVLIGLVSAMLLTSCGKTTSNGTNGTLSEYLNAHSKVESQLESEIVDSFTSADIDATMEVDGNDMNIVIDATKLLNDKIKTKTQNNIDILSEQFEESFAKLDSQMIDSIRKLEKETKIKGINVIVRVMWDEDEIYSHVYSAS